MTHLSTNQSNLNTTHCNIRANLVVAFAKGGTFVTKPKQQPQGLPRKEIGELFNHSLEMHDECMFLK